eukprot:g9482.t1
MGELERQELVAKNAFDEMDEDGNGYILISELHGLAASLGLPITPEEQDETLEALDQDNDGVFDREKWTKWWAQRWETNHPIREEDPSESKGGRGAPTGQADGEDEQESSGAAAGGERIAELAERARQARRRAGTDIHTAAWKGDVELVKGFLEDDPELANAVDVSEFGTGYRPLHYAAYGGFLDVCEVLHAAGARALAAGDNGVTALFLAAQAGKADVVQFLLSLGADPTSQERGSGLCAMDVVDESCPDIFRRMQEKGAFQPPTPLEAPPMVTRVASTSLQVAFLPPPDTKGALPVTRYKVKVEYDDGARAAGAGADRALTTAPDPDPATADIDTGVGEEGADSNGFAHPTLAQVVVVPARLSARPTSADGEQGRRRRTFVTIRGLKPRTRYRLQVAAVNAIGFGAYGPASPAVITSSKAEEQDDGSTAKGTQHPPGGSDKVAGSEKDRGRVKGRGKGRQVLAMERRRSLAAQATRLQEQQQHEAEKRQASRAQRHARRGDDRASGRPLADTTGGTSQRNGAGGAVGAFEEGSSLGGANQTRPLRQLPHHQRRQDRSESIDGNGRSAAQRETGTRAAKTTATPPRRSSPSATTTPAAHRGRPTNYRQPRLSKTLGSRPATTGTGDHRGHGEYSDGDGGDGYDYDGYDHDGTETLSGSRATARAERLVATAPASSVVEAEPAAEAEEPRYLAATVAGEMSVRAYPRRIEQSPFVEKGHATTVGPGGLQPEAVKASAVPWGVGRRAGQRQRHQRRRQGGGGRGRGGCGCSSSDVSVSSCGDMTISSEEQEGEELVYTG